MAPVPLLSITPSLTMQPVDEAKKRLIWKGISAGAAAVSVVVTQRLMTTMWRKVRGTPPPEGPADPRIALGPALTWAVAMGIGVAVSRMIAVRLSARAWEAATHEAPPEVT